MSTHLNRWDLSTPPAQYDLTMKRFSERIGAVEAQSVMQLSSMTDAMRNSIWNFLHSIYTEGDAGWWDPAEALSRWFFKLPVVRPHQTRRSAKSPQWNP